MHDAIVHPFAFTASGDDASSAQVGQMPRDLRLTLLENLDEEADADFAPMHEVEQPQPGRVGEGGKELWQVDCLGSAKHLSNVPLDRGIVPEIHSHKHI